MEIEFEKIITEAEARSFYIGLTDRNQQTYGQHFPPHLTKFVIIDGQNRATIAQKHHKNQVWGTLKHWFIANNIQANDQIRVIYNKNELINNINVLRLVPSSNIAFFKDTTEEQKNVLIGAGFGTPEKNKDVEETAVEFVRTHYIKKGWAVESVETLKCGFDLIAFKEKEVKNIEVKGISGEKQSIILTANEFGQAQKNDNFEICIVTKALTNFPNLTTYDGKQFLSKFNLSPLSYHAEIKHTT
jgi:hypothetical protein